MELEPTHTGETARVPKGGEIEAAPLNDPLWKDVLKDTASSSAEKIPILGTVIRVRDARKIERRLRLLEDVVTKLNISREELDARLASDEDLAELLARAWDVVASARSTEKVRLLANVVAAAVAGERVDVSTGHVLLGVVEQLEPAHLQTLIDVDEVARTPPPPEDDGTESTVLGARRGALEHLATTHPHVVAILLADLEAKQLIINAYHKLWGGLEGQEAWVLTDLGKQICKLLTDVARDDPLPADEPDH